MTMYIGLILVVLATFCQGEVVRECTFKAYLNDYLSDRTYGLLPCRYFEHGVLPKETLVVDISPNDTQGLWDECGKSDEYPCRFRDKLYWKKAYYWREKHGRSPHVPYPYCDDNEGVKPCYYYNKLMRFDQSRSVNFRSDHVWPVCDDINTDFIDEMPKPCQYNNRLYWGAKQYRMHTGKTRKPPRITNIFIRRRQGINGRLSTKPSRFKQWNLN
ncbi:secreted protein [Ostreid herpesvirus 1]|uniref:Uncharacterized protein n=1 Tax=Ostreid herpesvirus 1 TaxID=261939 RepID=V9QMJ6_OSHV1|nr:hypothetical protein [Ostreid herpesvirus 1]AHC31216.1 hypothetical protein [Ostreid herpesvirus 1]AHC31217.1 hypothetical protein [Ostreid herpesvirus 1]AHC31220.1 hypothetical protein [Ostreid herpesvirus 1]ASK05543.1 ORF15 [Ostreid herpesvirus 1]